MLHNGLRVMLILGLAGCPAVCGQCWTPWHDHDPCAQTDPHDHPTDPAHGPHGTCPEDPEDETPCPSTPCGQQCRDCICAGAVLDGSDLSRRSNESLATISSQTPLVAADAAPATAAAGPLYDRLPTLSGRGMRAWLCSLLC
jgi:hypothetical protein